MPQINDAVEEAEVDQPDAAIGPNRGQRYVGQGKTNSTVWCSMALPADRFRSDNLSRDRQISLSVVSNLFIKKAASFKTNFDARIIGDIIIETNRKATRVYAKNNGLQIPKRMPPLKDLTANELYAFIGHVLLAGAEKANLVLAKDLFAKDNMPIYRVTMSLERFEHITRFLRFDYSRTRPQRLSTDKLASF